MLQVLRGTSDANIPFDDLRRLLTGLGFEERIRGSHRIFINRIGVYLFLGVNLLPVIFLTWTGLRVTTEEMHVFFASVFVVLAFLNRTEFQPVFKRSEGSAIQQ